MYLRKAFDTLKKSFIENKILVAILSLAFLLRIYGASFDYPFMANYIWDEIGGITQIADMLTKMTFFTDHVSGYGFVLPLLYLPAVVIRIAYLALVNGLYTAGAIKGFLISGGLGQAYIIIRWYSVLFGVLTAYVVYKICQLIYEDKRTALYTTLAYSVAILPVSLAHWGKVHVPMAFFFILSLYFILQFEKTKEVKNFYYSSIAAALSFSTHYIGIAAGIFPLAAFFLNRPVIKTKTLAKALVVYFGLALLFYGINYKGVSIMFQANTGNGASGMNKDSTLIERVTYPFTDLFWLDPVMMSILLVAILARFKKIYNDKLLRYFLFGLANVYLMLTAFIAWPGMIRWLLVFLTMLIVLGVSSVVQILFESERLKKYFHIVMVLLLTPSLVLTLLWLRTLNANTRFEVISWMRENLPRGKLIYSFDRILDPELSYMAAGWEKENNKLDSKKNDYIISNKEIYQDKGIDLIHDYEHYRYKDLGGPDTDYVLMAYWKNTNRLYRSNGERKYYYPDGDARDEVGETLAEISKYHKLELVKTFYPTSDSSLMASGVGDYLNNPWYFYDIVRLEKSGPFVEIYKIVK